MTTLQLIFAFCIAFGLTAIPLYIRAAKVHNIINVPTARSSHATPAPREE